MKNKRKTSYEPVDKTHYKKKYLLRVVEHGEAEKEIQNAKRKQSTDVDAQVSEVQRLDETPSNKHSDT